ncbi:MAG: hypothetical protein QG650_685, partial [Patescibacteria group bacterium]|nr:hypothetical protein [Patescibacteria group bacterium]
ERRESVTDGFGGAVLGMSDIPLKQSDMPRARNRNQVRSRTHPFLILNLDLDFFAPDLDYVPFPLKKEAILAFAERSDLITVATSPCFIDQELALRRLREVFDRT